MELVKLRPGMENIDLELKLTRLDEPREVTSHRGTTHNLVEGLIKDDSGEMGMTVWNELIEQLEGIEPPVMVKLSNCFITSFKGVLSVNVGRDSSIEKMG